MNDRKRREKDPASGQWVKRWPPAPDGRASAPDENKALSSAPENKAAGRKR